MDDAEEESEFALWNLGEYSLIDRDEQDDCRNFK